jgi:hypothetical protein
MLGKIFYVKPRQILKKAKKKKLFCVCLGVIRMERERERERGFVQPKGSLTVSMCGTDK